MLTELAVTPDVFASSAYVHPDVCDLHLRSLKDFLAEAGVVRDLRNGDWSEQFFTSSPDQWHRRAKELLKKLKQSGRLRSVDCALPPEPANAFDWCREALESNEKEPLNSIVATKGMASNLPGIDCITPIETISSAGWWKAAHGSVRLKRRSEDYLVHLKSSLRFARHVMFLDPYIDPRSSDYRDFLQLVIVARDADLIEIHRVAFDKDLVELKEWQARFAPWDRELKKSNLGAEVFLWDRFHDRYLITDLIGISLPHGFGTTNDINGRRTTWTRLSRDVREDVQREFDAAQNPRWRFRIGK